MGGCCQTPEAPPELVDIVNEISGPLPEFTYQAVAVKPDDLKWNPEGDVIHPSIITTEHITDALGTYYMYYSPHRHKGMGMCYSNSLNGPWTEYENNPVIPDCASADILWISDENKYFMYAHQKNAYTEYWTTTDGINFELQGTAIHSEKIDTANATYSRTYEYIIEAFDNKYIMLYSGLSLSGDLKDVRSIWLAYSSDARNWTQLTVPLVSPSSTDEQWPLSNEVDIFGPSFIIYNERNYIGYQDAKVEKGGNIKYVEVDKDFTAIGESGERFFLVNAPLLPPVWGRYRGGEFYWKDDTIYLYVGQGRRDSEDIVYFTAQAS